MDNRQYPHFRKLSALLSVVLALSIGACSSTPEKSEPAGSEPMGEAQLQTQSPVREKIVLKPDYPRSYTVVQGDTLWDIAGRYLRDPWRWPELWQKNPQVENPHLIYPGDILTLIYIGGEPVIQVQRPGSLDMPAEVRGRDYQTVKLSPRIREEQLDRSIPTISLDVIEQLLTRPHIVSQRDLDTAPYIVSSDDQHLIAGAGHTIFVRGLTDVGGAEFTIVRQGEEYRNSEGELLGFEAIHVADARLKSLGDPATMVITASKRETLVGDQLLAATDDGYSHNFVPTPPASKVNGKIISVVDAVSMIGQYQVVVVDLGREQGMEQGNVLAVKQSGPKVRDRKTGEWITLPEQQAGVGMVFRIFDRLSYVLIMRATRPILIGDSVTNP